MSIPSVGGTEYHPFSVASTSADPRWRNCLLLHCKAYSKWTQKLLEGAQAGTLDQVEARVQGPFHSHSMSDVEIDALRHMIVVVGGVGGPTVLPILKHLALSREQVPNHAGASQAQYSDENSVTFMR